MKLPQYLEMWNRIGKWQKEKNETRLPNYVKVADMNIGVDKVTSAQLLDMIKRVKNWQNSHDGTMPQVIGIEGAASDSEPPKDSIRAYAESKLGRFNNMTEFYNKLIGKGYKKYYHDQKTRKQTIDGVASSNPNDNPNCTDIMQVFHDLAIEMGYQCRFVHVKCLDGKGHIRGQIKGKEFGDWTRVDPAAALSVGSRYPIGRVWCDYTNAHIENENWVVTDDADAAAR